MGADHAAGGGPNKAAVRLPPPKVRLSGMQWFPMPDAVEGNRLVALERAPRNEEAIFAGLYLLSVVALPLLVAFAVWHPFDLPDPLYGVPVTASALLP